VQQQRIFDLQARKARFFKNTHFMENGVLANEINAIFREQTTGAENFYAAASKNKSQRSRSPVSSESWTAFFRNSVS
jgi:hypothetical protein